MQSGKQFVFVVGVPRSGTTWLFNMLAEHADICSLDGANTLFQHYIFQMEKMYQKEELTLKSKGFNRGMPSKFTPEEFHGLLSEYVNIFYQQLPANQPFYVEKATDLLSEAANILRFIPQAKFIHIVRDGRDSALSDMKYRKKYGPPLGIENIYEAALRWKDDTSAFRQQMNLHPEQMLEVKYEDLLVDTVPKLQEIFEFMGCNISSEITARIAKKFDHRSNPVSKPTSGVADKQGKPLHPYLTEMPNTEQAVFEYLAGNTLSKYGYQTSSLMSSVLFSFYIKWFCVSRYFAVKSGKPLRFWLSALRRKLATSSH